MDLIETPCEADGDYPFGRRWRVSFASGEGLLQAVPCAVGESVWHMLRGCWGRLESAIIGGGSLLL